MKQVAFETWLWRTLGHFKPGKSRVGDLPPEALAYLTLQNPALRDLKERYSRFTGAPHSSWSSWEEKVNLTKFRGENDYLSQAYFTRTTRRYEMTCAYAEATDELGLLDRFTEDDLFGVKTWPFLPGKPVTRDLLDSVIELTWLSKALGFGLNDSFRILGHRRRIRPLCAPLFQRLSKGPHHLHRRRGHLHLPERVLPALPQRRRAGPGRSPGPSRQAPRRPVRPGHQHPQLERVLPKRSSPSGSTASAP